MPTAPFSTPSAPAPSLEGWRSLSGHYVRVWPYARGAVPRDLPYHLWRIVEEDGQAAHLFHGQVVLGQTGYGLRGDLLELIGMFVTGARILLIVQSVTSGDLAGFIWFDDLVPGHRCSANIFIRKAYYGPAAMEAGTLGLNYVLSWLEYPTVWAFTPWPRAAAFARRLGFHEMARLPGFALTHQGPRDIIALRIRQEDRHG